MNTKMCNVCKNTKPTSEFYTNGKYLRYQCKQCEKSAVLARRNTEYGRSLWNKWRRTWERKSRANVRHRARWILEDSRRADRKRRRKNDLTKQFIEASIQEGCRYCGESHLKMTLDRIDNSKGHTKRNVVASCIRCNIIRRDMPYEAWQFLVPRMREARKRGLFQGWN